ncbi:TonB-dependent receptor [Sphingomonas aquatilis NBRC 16722]|uniref:TonB-dependent receptor n=1 Tax=Sphingomonas aquatilis TaxID=93063 RepID=A0AAW3TPG6_9SPHN|nr:TonB-dependent receptor [Sphingomonas aquatilis]MBB3874287.1 TonB-dependent receptor [Sphingomonas aquatilis]GEM70482.1 TonB-dependent receptor [Sphingomonas aquatilis NBRC 16722]
MLSTNTPTRPMLRRFLLCSAAGIVLAPAPLVAQSTSSTGQANSASIASPAVQPNPVQQAAPPAQAAGAGEPADPIAAAAQDVGEAGADIVVTGARATQRTSIELKRNATVVVDGLVSDEIGATPDNSVGDTLERIAGVSADRFKGNANELSVRGLGPTLSFATFNGREVSTAGGDRSVAFQQFPSELVNGVLVYKTQQADFLEGGVGGIIELRSIKPLDYGKRRLQAEIRGDFQPKADDVYQDDGLGYRANVSYTDVFKTGIGDIGVSIGFQRQDTTAPEDYYNANATFQPCNTSALNPSLLTGTAAQLTAAGASANCALTTGPRAVTGTTVGESRGDTYYANSSRSFRTQQTSEVRNALIGAVQWRPAPDFDITFDGQYSTRDSLEKRNVLGITEGLRGVQPLIVGTGSNGYSKGALISYRGNSFVEDQLERRQRNEDYIGGGLSLNWTPGPWQFTADASFSKSHRTETQKQTRMRSTNRVAYTLSYLDDDVVPNVTFDNFDVTDPANFLNTAANAVYARNRFVTDRKDEIWAGRFDVNRELEGFFTAFKFGARYSSHHRTNDNARNSDLNTLTTLNGQTPAQLITAANLNCRAPFTTQSYMRGVGTNVTRWATFDNDCLFRTFTGSDSALPYPADGRDPSDIDVRESIYAAYAMASFRGDAGTIPYSGNIGGRFVDTRITSKGYRQAYLITIDPGADTYTVAVDPTGQLTQNTAKGHYRYFLPSSNLSFDLSQQLKLRLAAYRAIARSGIESFGAGVNLNPSTGTGTNNIIFNATTGNPNLKPLRAWNTDASLELYASKDTLVAIAGYYKWITGAVIGRSEPIPTNITVTTTSTTPGAPRQTQNFTINPVAPANDLNTRHLYGFEATVSHAFTWLPSPLDGFGVNGSVGRAWADFEFPETSPIQTTTPIVNFVEPANLIGLSNWTGSGSVYFEKWGLSLRANARYRSSYYKPNGGTNRSVREGTYLNLSAQYNISKTVQLKAQALNVTGTKDVFYKGGYDSIAEVSNSGPQYFFGFRVRL